MAPGLGPGTDWSGKAVGSGGPRTRQGGRRKRFLQDHMAKQVLLWVGFEKMTTWKS